MSQLDNARSFLRSTAIRQTLVLLSVFFLITTIAWLATYWVVIRDTNRLVELRLEVLMDSTFSALSNGESLPVAGPGQYLAQLPVNGVQQGALPEGFNAADKRTGFHRMESTKDSGQADYVLLVRDSPGFRIIAGENVERLEEATDILLVGLLFAIFFSVLAACVAGLWIARRNQARLDRISSGLARVSDGDLESRISLQGPDDDLKLLANRIDATTEQLESAMTQMRMQSANIAHDLRTPLARLRSVLEERHIALTERNEPVSEKVLASALYQIDQIGSAFNALLRIARIESGAQKSTFKAIDLGELANDVKEIFGPVIEERGQTMAVELKRPAHITGDPEMIIQLAGNLIQNALSFGVDGQKISLVVDGTQLSISDQGPGIPFDERERVLQPLYQLENPRQGEGHGLGLALVSAICKLHDAQLSLADGPGSHGLTVTVRFPSKPH
ncbi:MAG: HAMP domain-containing histidine kinase [Granulosicoccus sp.]|nr:HAMP domain-containing histidine kinase [Granulosicoccus sp.]